LKASLHLQGGEVEILRSEMGLVHIYTGNGKGKTTAALGLAVRATGRGKKVLMVQFMKSPGVYGEWNTAKIMPGFEIRATGLNCLINADKPEPEDIHAAQEALKMAAEEMASGRYDLVILDEVNVAIKWGLITTKQVLEAVQNRKEGVEVVMTGRYAPKELREIADYITEMRCIRHPYEKGVLARNGVER